MYIAKFGICQSDYIHICRGVDSMNYYVCDPNFLCSVTSESDEELAVSSDCDKVQLVMDFETAKD